ncbi:hemolysin family protein [Lysobacter solisilvae (ex Woo and Kim 2020)]|uniref:HlyC/CorC family transporter n=1 Tax=Agrilutibacter terrestris TaxID=2865112 RepID=A0A7H0FVU5_9GAMM|nr:hemolysin family protein [Lysobacter terrestris]QNP40161.1 HlyC/CorC family transporter [Lysobacter terrestris]
MLHFLIVLALILFNAFFAMSEMAVMTSRKSRLKQMAQGSRRAAKALELSEHPESFLSAVQLWITLLSLLTGYFGGESMGDEIAAPLRNIPLLAPYAGRIGFAAGFLLMLFLFGLVGELVPKRIGTLRPEQIATAVAFPMDFFAKAAKPFVMTLAWCTRTIMRLIGLGTGNDERVTEEEIRLLVSESHEQGVIDADERKMMNRVLSLGDRTAESLMTPRVRIAWLDAAASLEENLATMREHAYSRYPVYRGSDSDVAGILEVKTLLDRLGHADPDLFGELREALFVSESTHALKLLEIFREEQQSFALVVDEYGDVSGVVSINDVMGAVMGRIYQSDEDDEHEPPVVEREDGSWYVDGALPLEELRELVGGGALPGELEHDFHTAAGMVIAHFGRIPHVGENFRWNDWRIEVVDLDGPRIDKLLLQRQPGDEDRNDDDGAA